jgi:hypothetical protein
MKRYIAEVVTVLLLAVFPLAAAAQGDFFALEPVWSSNPMNATSSVALGDVDGDGDLDLVFANATNHSIALYESTDDGVSLDPVWSLTTSVATNSVALGDIDGDGDLDLVCGNGTDSQGQSNTAYENTGGVFSTSPMWSSVPDNFTTGVALGDIDGDGDLDLVCGNYGDGNTVYENTGATFSTSPLWLSATANMTMSVALGDVDGDGDLDLVCGNAGQSNTTYENTGGIFSATPVWSSDALGSTRSLALGDIDGDGDLDLVCGNGIESNTVYANAGTWFTALPVWRSDPAKQTSAVALGDIDGDGDLDLVCGNTGSDSNTVYDNTGDGFSTLPVWLAESRNGTACVALGDIDRDGDLDLVCGNDGANTVYEHEGFRFPGLPQWSSDDTSNHTGGMVAADIDGDGDVDVVCGNYGEANTVYENVDDVLSASPTKWSSMLTNKTIGIDLGDIDGDGDLDLACGNYDQSNTVYENTGGTFTEFPAWSSTTRYNTYDVALGDVDGDGDLDLVGGNWRGKNTLYRNAGGTIFGLSTSPVWKSQIGYPTFCITLADIDGDGDLDLVCGNQSQRNNIYENTGRTFTTTPVWQSDERNDTYAVFLGDIDGDGDPDLLCGNAEQPNTIYENIGGVLSTSPVWWSDEINLTRYAALADMDGDGDLDIVCGNWKGGNAIYENTGGAISDLPTSPMWVSTPMLQTWGGDLADIDRDGDIDMLFGNFGNENTVYYGTRNPAFAGDPLAPTNHLANNGAFIRPVGARATETNRYTVNFQVHDVESDNVWVVADYQFEGGVWRPVDLVGGGNRVGPLVTTPGGVIYSMTWDISSVPFELGEVVLRLRSVEIPNRVSVIQHASPYRLQVGSVVPIRPAVSTSPDDLSYLGVTVGDTASLDLVVSNVGTDDLTVTAIELPSAEMLVTGTTPFTLTPGDSETLTVSVAPRVETHIAGYLRVMSDDPFTPVDSVQVITQILQLQFSSELLSAADSLPLGEAVSVRVNPAPLVHIERGEVFHRPSGQAGFSQSVPLVPDGSVFVATIPGEHVTEAGLDYYVEVENSGLFATDPAAAPDSFYTRPVAGPEGIASNPVPNSGDDFLMDTEVTVQALLPQGAEFVWGSLYYRGGGAAAFTQTDLQLGSTIPEAAIPAGIVGATGVEYWIEVHTLQRHLTDPPHDPAMHPRTIAVTVPDLVESQQHPGWSFRIMSVPLQFDGDFTGTVEALLSDQPEFGPYDQGRWKCWAYLSETNAYVELNDPASEDLFHPQPGRAWWLISREDHRVSTAPVTGMSVPTDGPYGIELAADSWSMVGCPFAFAVSWDSIQVDSLTMAEAIRDGVIGQPWGWDNDWFTDIDAVDPFDGCWVYNFTDHPVTLWVPPVEATQTQATPVLARDAESDGWRLTLAATTAGVSDRLNTVGMSSSARPGLDQYDRVEPPSLPNGGLALYFLRSDNARRYAADVRPLPDDGGELGAVWAFDVAKQFSSEGGGDEVIIAFDGLDDVPGDARIVLVDRKLDRHFPITEGEDYRFYLGHRDYVKSHDEARFRLIVGTESFVRSAAAEMVDLPTKTALYQNYPNPFNPATVIRYEVAEAGEVTIRIYNVRGALVKTLYDGHRKPGRYEVGWNGENRRGEPVSSGVYFYRMETPGFVDTRKIVLLR